MDESLSDFKEPKRNIAGPKKAKPNSVKPKKAPKRIRGQKDIRTALQAKKELEAYTKDFHNVCKHAGLDVDSEQLQLAIALSKSLQASTSNEGPDTSQSLSTQDRVGKIRTTLLEYGFKVPEIKIKQTATRRLKKRKNYKLLLTSDEAKQQIITDKYSQVLFQNITETRLSLNTDADCHSHLYILATSARYNILKIKDTFYVDDLLEKSTSTGNLLRDWSEIPGRPVTPKICEPSTMDFSEIECSQDELDIILSGSLKSCKNIVRSKGKVVFESKMRESIRYNLDKSCIVLVDENPQENKTLETNETLCPGEPIGLNNQLRSCSPDLFDDELSLIDNTKEDKLHLQYPEDNYMDFTDINQDQTGLQNHNPGLNLSQNTNTTRLNDVMEITECVDVHLGTNKTVIPQSSQNMTKRKSNFMEITNCCVAPILPLQIANSIDLTESPEENNTTPVVVAHKTEKLKNRANDLDETLIETHLIEDIATKVTNCIENRSQSDDTTNSSNEKIPRIKTVTEERNVDLTESPEVSNGIEKANETVESLDLTQSSNTSDELPFVSLKANKNSQSADDTIIVEPKDYENILHKESTALIDKDEILDLTQTVPNEACQLGSCNAKEVQEEMVFDLTQSIQNYKTNTPLKVQEDSDLDLTQNVNRKEILDLTQEVVMTSKNNSRTSENNVSFYDEYVHNHSDSYEVHDEINCDSNFYKDSSSKEIERDVDQSSSKSTAKHDDDDDDVDLTQDSDSSTDLSQDEKHSSKANNSITLDSEDESNASEIIVSKSSQRYSSLGKKDDVSIDYDDYDMANENSLSKRSSKSTRRKSTDQSKDTSNCSQDSEVFVISDNELDYSMHQSKLEMPRDNFLFGGISVMDELSGVGSFRKSINTENNVALSNKNLLYNDAIEEVVDNQVEADRLMTPVKHKRINELSTPQKASCSGINTVLTPSNNEYLINTDVTPMPDYESMTLFEIHKELDKFGVKPFKRKRAIQLLTHIYNETHPTVEPCEESPCKRRKTNDYESPRYLTSRKKSPRKVPQKSPTKNQSPNKTLRSPIKYAGIGQGIAKATVRNSKDDQRLNSIDVVSQNYETTEVPVIKEVACSPEDWVFQKREKAKVYSCRVPLHIAFHNYVSSRRGLREAILCYEPINIDDVHKDLVAYGHRYDPKDLLKFMDKKCITVKTTDNDARNKR